MSPETHAGALSNPGPFGGLLSIFYSPSDAFVPGRRRGWLVPMAAACLLALLANIFLLNKVGLETITRNQLQANTKLVERMGQQEIDRISREAGESQNRKIMVYAGAAIGTALVICLFAAILLGALSLTGGSSNFSNILTAVAYPQYALLALNLVGMLVVLSALNDYSSLDPRNLVMLNPSLFLDRTTTSKAVYSIVSSFDLLSFWYLFLLSTGVSRMSTGVSFKKALGIVIVLWLVWVLGKAAVSSLF